MYRYRESKMTASALLAAVMLCVIVGNLLDPLSIVRIIIALIPGMLGSV